MATERQKKIIKRILIDILFSLIVALLTFVLCGDVMISLLLGLVYFLSILHRIISDYNREMRPGGSRYGKFG